MKFSMGKIIDKIKEFFSNILSRNMLKKLEPPKVCENIKNENFMEDNKVTDDNKIADDNKITADNKIMADSNISNEKKEFFDIYNKIKAGEYDLKDLSEKQAKKVIAILNSEISLKKDRLKNDVMELNILKIDNKIDEKNRLLKMYNEVKNGSINLSEIDKNDLLKIRRLLLEEAKIQDEKLEEQLYSLNVNLG